MDCQQVAEWVAGGGKGLGASEMAVSNAIAGNASLCKRIHACQGASMPSSEAEFSGAVRAVQNMLGCQGATAEVLEYFGGEKPHAGAPADTAASSLSASARDVPPSCMCQCSQTDSATARSGHVATENGGWYFQWWNFQWWNSAPHGVCHNHMLQS